jgi:hypothetical protein
MNAHGCLDNENYCLGLIAPKVEIPLRIITWWHQFSVNEATTLQNAHMDGSAYSFVFGIVALVVFSRQ